MRSIETIACILMLCIAGPASAASAQSEPEELTCIPPPDPTEPEDLCRSLLERGDRLAGIDDPDIRELGLQKLRDAVGVCNSAEVTPETRARALMTTVRLFSDDRAKQRQMWSEAVSLLREHAPDSRLLLRALEGLLGATASDGNPDESLRLAFEALEESKRIFGVESRDYIRGLTYVALTYQWLAEVASSQDYLAEAQRYAEEAMDRARRVLGLRDGTTMTAAAVLRSVLNKRGFTERAEELEQEIAPYVDLDDPLDF